VAGVRTEDGKGWRTCARSSARARSARRPGTAAGGNTTIAVVATNAQLSKAE
jgi:L-aminopeptidase/D-esterase-like protein